MQNALAIGLSVALTVVVFLVVLRIRHVKTYRMPNAERKRILARTILTGLLVEVSLLWVLTVVV